MRPRIDEIRAYLRGDGPPLRRDELASLIAPLVALFDRAKATCDLADRGRSRELTDAECNAVGERLAAAVSALEAQDAPHWQHLRRATGRRPGGGW